MMSDSFKIDRDYMASPEMNKEEHIWWNKNAAIISRVWEMEQEVSYAVRKGYLKRIKKFFCRNSKKSNVLELGCGSGWVGQFICSSNLHILGFDFSESQIKLAIKRAKSKKIDHFCDYRIEKDIDWAAINKIDGVLIHSFLHHLDGKEIDELFMNIRRFLQSGTKILIYEPTYYKEATNKHNEISFFTKCIYSISSSLSSKIDRLLIKLNLIDKEVLDSFIYLVESAKKKAWFLSPKEVPFEIKYLTNQLYKYFIVENHYWATIFLIRWSFNMNLIKNKILRKFFTFSVLPILRQIDRYLASDEIFLKQMLIAPKHAFHVWECTIQ